MAKPTATTAVKIPGVIINHGRYYKAVSDYVDGKRKQKLLPLTRVDEGESALYAALAKRTAARAEQPGNTPARIDEFCKVYLPTLAPSSRKEYARVLADCKIAFELLNTEDITPADVQDLLNQIKTPRMKHHYKSRLSTFFRWCCAPMRYAKTNPCREITISVPRARRIEWTSETWHTIHNNLPPMLQCYMDLCFLLYQRTTDIRLLTIPQTSGTGVPVTPTKTSTTSGKNVTIPITPAIRAVLDRAAEIRKAYATRKGYNATFFVIAKPDGQPYSATGIHSAFKRAQHRAGLSGYNPKSIRPYAAASAERAGYTLRQIQNGLAHASIGTTEGYLEQHRESISVIELSLPTPPPKQIG